MRRFSPQTRLAVLLLVMTLVASACTRSTPGDLADCERTTTADTSVAQVWNEVLLDGIRRDFPAPTVHARNLFHVSAAMWDAWAAYDEVAIGYFVDESHEASDVTAARETAMSYAAYGVLRERYRDAIGGDRTLADFDATMTALCLDQTFTGADGSAPAELGNRIAATILEFGEADAAREDLAYSPQGYESVNEPMPVDEPGTVMTDPNRWQPLALDVMVAQNGVRQLINVQEFVGPHWGSVTSFALPESDAGLPIDPGAPPYLGDPKSDEAFKAAVVEVIEFSSLLDPASGAQIDIGPGSLGNNHLGTNDGSGYAINPVTGGPYEPTLVNEADFGRVLAEFWADGPASETPPGHWNTLANTVSDRLADQGRAGRLEWDAKLYFALNGALHDAAIAAWGAKAYYDYVRPISMIRYMGGLGQSTHPDGPSYDPAGLPLVEDLIEVITAQSSAPGERHAHLANYLGEIAVFAWNGASEPDPNAAALLAGTAELPDGEAGPARGVGWIRAVEWVPYQRATFVTPAFAGYVSGHSAFSRAAAEVLTGFTGSPYFPDGLGEWVIPVGSLEFEAGPSTDVPLRWASYYDAADQAGISRLYGGIHVTADDLQGRILGSQCGTQAWNLAQRYFDGTA